MLPILLKTASWNIKITGVDYKVKIEVYVNYNNMTINDVIMTTEETQKERKTTLKYYK